MEMEAVFAFGFIIVAGLGIGLIIWALLSYRVKGCREAAKEFLALQETTPPMEIVGTVSQSPDFKAVFLKQSNEYCFQCLDQDGKTVQIVVANGFVLYKIPFTGKAVIMERGDDSNNKRIFLFHEELGLQGFHFNRKEKTLITIPNPVLDPVGGILA